MGSLIRVTLSGLLLSLPTCALPERSGPSAPSEPHELPGVEPIDVEAGGSILRLRVDPDQSPLPPSSFEKWTRRSASMVSEYYRGAFPVPDVDLVILVEGDGAIDGGEHRDGERIKIWLGRSTTESDLVDDWVMVHEMLHTGFPDLHRRHCWLQEGLSTYLEPIIRARAEALTEVQVWTRFAKSLRHGLPIDDQGLDGARDWGRTYWGGALFWLRADLALRKRTDDRLGLRDAIVGIVEVGGNGRVDWRAEHVMWLADEVTSTNVFSRLYQEMGRGPGTVDLDALLEELGVVVHADGTVELDDTAPSAHLRRSIVLGNANGS